MYVKEEYRGRGYSKKLNDAILEKARILGYTKVYLKTELENYYEKFGVIVDLKGEFGQDIQQLTRISQTTHLSSFFILLIMSEDVANRIKELNTEDFIWIIYLGIIFFSYVANHQERKYFLNNDIKAKENYRTIMIFIFVVLILVYLYFLKDSLNSLKNLKPNASDKERYLSYLSFIASLLIVISGIIFLYIAISDEDINVELAFN